MFNGVVQFLHVILGFLCCTTSKLFFPSQNLLNGELSKTFRWWFIHFAKLYENKCGVIWKIYDYILRKLNTIFNFWRNKYFIYNCSLISPNGPFNSRDATDNALHIHQRRKTNMGDSFSTSHTSRSEA